MSKTIESQYKQSKSLGERCREYNRIKAKFPSHTPVIIDSHDIKLNKNKFLIEGDMNISQLIYAIRKQTQLKPHEAMFIYVDNVLVNITKSMNELWESYHDEDGFIYLRACKENTFGNIFNNSINSKL